MLRLVRDIFELLFAFKAAGDSQFLIHPAVNGQ